MDFISQLEVLRSMLYLRIVETGVLRAHRAGRIPDGVHPGIGGEALAVAVGRALRPDDYLADTHRGLSRSLAKGLPLRKALLELVGSVEGASKGRGTHTNLSWRPASLIGSNHVVGAAIGVAAGAAFTIKYNGNSGVAVAIVGDGGVNTGRLYEVLNLAALWELPLVVIVEDNGYAVSTPRSSVWAGPGVVARAQSFGVNATGPLEGNALELCEGVASVVESVRSGSGPHVIHVIVHRHEGHWPGDWGGYRSAQEVNGYLDADPMRRLTDLLVAAECITKPGVSALIAAFKDEFEQELVAVEKIMATEVAKNELTLL